MGCIGPCIFAPIVHLGRDVTAEVRRRQLGKDLNNRQVFRVSKDGECSPPAHFEQSAEMLFGHRNPANEICG